MRNATTRVPLKPLTITPTRKGRPMPGAMPPCLCRSQAALAAAAAMVGVESRNENRAAASRL